MAHNIPPIKLLGGYIPSIPPSLTPLDWPRLSRAGCRCYLSTISVKAVNATYTNMQAVHTQCNSRCHDSGNADQQNTDRMCMKLYRTVKHSLETATSFTFLRKQRLLHSATYTVYIYLCFKAGKVCTWNIHMHAIIILATPTKLKSLHKIK